MKTFKPIVYIFSLSLFIISDSIMPNDLQRSAPHHENKPKENSTTYASHSRDIAEWTFLTYIAADNNLAPYADYNINSMQAGLAATAGINVLVQWDQPNNNKTWRYKITPSGKIEDASISDEMGYDPAKELVQAMQWVTSKYQARRYALVLWDHGSGIEDFSPGVVRSLKIRNSATTSWLKIPETKEVASESLRGILYDDSQQTCLTNQGLTAALTAIKKMIGKNIDLLATDACLMSMVEVVYQIKGLVDVFVGSEQTIPGNGYPYEKFIRPLSLNPGGTDAAKLAAAMVTGYNDFYSRQEPTSDFTLSAINVSKIELLKENIDQFVLAVAACKEHDAILTKTLIKLARRASTEFEMPEYIDLYSFYMVLAAKIKKTSPKSYIVLSQNNKSGHKPSTGYLAALENLKLVANAGIQILSQVVMYNASGIAMPHAKGLAIYYPTSGGIHSSYPLTLFAQNSSWIDFIKEYR